MTPHQASFVVRGSHLIMPIIFSDAFSILKNDPNHKDRESLEQIISGEADASYCYAIAVKQCRWELGEAAISTSAEMSFFYSRWAIQGRLPDIMHRKMLAFGITDSSDEDVKKYFGKVLYLKA